MKYRLHIWDKVRAGALAVIIGCFAQPLAHAHTILDPQQVESMLTDIAWSHEASHSAKSAAIRADAFYNVGVKTTALVNLINADAMAHGDTDPQLLKVILARLQSYDVSVKKSLSGYTYDFTAFREYLKISPDGKHAASARFVLIKY